MILITGANGFIGRNLVRYASENRISVLASGRRLYDGYFDALKVPFIELDVTRKEDFDKIKESIDSVIHLASLVPNQERIPSAEECINVNGLGTLNTLEFCQRKGIKRFAYISSSTVIGSAQYSPIAETHPTYPRGRYAAYGMSKLLGELFCERFRTDLGLNCICLRFSMVYGCGQKDHLLIPRLIKSALESRKIVIHGSSEFVLDLLYLKDAIAAIMSALKSNRQGIYNIGSGQKTPLNELAAEVASIFTNSKAEIIFETSGSSEGKGFYLDISRAKKELKFKPKYSLRKGLEDMKNETRKSNKIF